MTGPATRIVAAAAVPVVVVGSGAAGLMAACTAAERTDVVLITDRGLGTSNTAVAQGGIQLPLDGDAALERFRADIVRSGGDGADPERVEHFVRMVAPTVDRLVAWGLALDRDAEGRLLRRSAGGLSEPRIVTAGDRIGAALLRVLRARVESLDIPVHTATQVVDLRPAHDVIHVVTATGDQVDAHAVVVAVGGTAFQHATATGEPTSNPANRNATLRPVLHRLGLIERDADLYQYQPYGIVHPHDGPTGKCVPESVSELGARVVDVHGEPVAAPGVDRRVLTAAMFDAVRSGRGIPTGCGRPALRLTIGALDQAELARRYPHLVRVRTQADAGGGDLLVEPVLHYQLGGFAIRPDGSTTVPGLFLAGEVTGGLHGHNRLMGNGITEAIVDGFVAGAAAAEHASRRTGR